jgi:hypothetical protein
MVKGSVDSRIIFLDLEASGLHRTSYPIEVGWAFLDLSAEGFLLRPAPEWTGWDWSFEPEKIHGISRAECLRSGIDVRDAAMRLNEALSGAQLHCDSPGLDGDWLRKLFGASGVALAFDLRLQDTLTPIRTALAQRGEDLWAIEQRLQAVCPRPAPGGRRRPLPGRPLQVGDGARLPAAAGRRRDGPARFWPT